MIQITIVGEPIQITMRFVHLSPGLASIDKRNKLIHTVFNLMCQCKWFVVRALCFYLHRTIQEMKFLLFLSDNGCD